MATSFQFGDIRIDRLVEQEAPFMGALEMFPTLSTEQLDAERHWLEPQALDRLGNLLMSFHAFVVRTPRHTVLVDSCIGNDKQRTRQAWNLKRDDAFMRGLSALGLSVGDIDFVLCTHLHTDHVGWNTRLEDGRWVPTFPNARYQFAQSEYEHWQRVHATAPVPAFGDSVLPVVEAGRADIVSDEHMLGDHIRLIPTPGHTPGHVAVGIGRGRDDAVLTGDLIHTPLQLRYPELSPRFDADPAEAATTRRAFLERYCDTSTLCCTMHFPAPSCGHIKRWGEGFRCDMATLP
jgi:glyoxylase-like metal-dependent hydrolase (beta-lactamase superfamily II)